MKPRRRYLTPREKAEVIARQKGRCACGCREKLGDDPRDIEFDHALDLQWGGTNDLENFRALKKRHHLKKTTKAAKERAKVERIRARGGMTKKRLSATDKALARMLETRRT